MLDDIGGIIGNPCGIDKAYWYPEDIGRFRLSGEVHQWMYDRVSLGRLLTSAGFSEVRVCQAQDSAIADFASYQLDTDEAGAVRKPDSLFMEARKPA